MIYVQLTSVKCIPNIFRQRKGFGFDTRAFSLSSLNRLSLRRALRPRCCDWRFYEKSRKYTIIKWKSFKNRFTLKKEYSNSNNTNTFGTTFSTIPVSGWWIINVKWRDQTSEMECFGASVTTHHTTSIRTCITVIVIGLFLIIYFFIWMKKKFSLKK